MGVLLAQVACALKCLSSVGLTLKARAPLEWHAASTLRPYRMVKNITLYNTWVKGCNFAPGANTCTKTCNFAGSFVERVFPPRMSRN